MITKELIKSEIDMVQEEYLEALFKIIKAFEVPAKGIDVPLQASEASEWKAFINKFAGCMADNPIKRGEQGEYEIREKLI